MAGKIEVTVNNRIWLYRDDVDIDLVRKAYARRLYMDHKCRGCPVQSSRHTMKCNTCPYYLGWAKFFSSTDDKIGIPAGALEPNLRKIGISLDDVELIDETVEVPMPKPELKFTSVLYNGTELIEGFPTNNQVQAVEDLLAYDSGILLAPPRSGKTRMGTNAICKLQQRALVIVHEDGIANQFYEEILEVTNAKSIPNSVGIATTNKKFSKFSHIVITTWHRLNHMSEDDYKEYIESKFGLVMIDEVDLAASEGFNRVTNFLNTKHRYGLTGTIERKDGLEDMMLATVGPVRHEAKVNAMIPTMSYIRTNIPFKFNKRAAYANILSTLAKDKERNDRIALAVKKILESSPDSSVLITVMRVVQHNLLEAAIRRVVAEEDYLRIVHVKGSASTANAQAIAACKSGEARVCIAMHSKVSRAISVPNWTHLIISMPTNSKNIFAKEVDGSYKRNNRGHKVKKADPNFNQVSMRVCTLKQGKPKPYVIQVVDDFPLSAYCFRNNILLSAKTLGYKIPRIVYSLCDLIKDYRGLIAGHSEL